MIIASLLAMLGLQTAGQALSSPLRSRILAVLRPAESAVRRLIAVAASRLASQPRIVCPFPKGIAWSSNNVGAVKPSTPKFTLTDPQPPISVQEDIDPAYRRLRITVLTPEDPTIPAIWAAHRATHRIANPKPRVDPDQKATVRLSVRLQAIAAALENLPRQARRLQRWKARRERLSRHRLIHTSPLRPGKPPGHSAAPGHQVSQVLQECHELAFEAQFNTS